MRTQPRSGKRSVGFACILVVLLGLGAASGARADIIHTTGAIDPVNPPTKVLDLMSNNRIYVFPEGSVALANKLHVDITKMGDYQKKADLTPGDIPANTKVDSFFLHFFPPPDQGLGTVERSGSITFNRDILGVIVLDGSLDASDPVLGVARTTYPTNVLGRGLELVPNADARDVVLVSQDLRGISVDLRDGKTINRYDELRIILPRHERSSISRTSVA
jgi:hypothetical protein